VNIAEWKCFRLTAADYHRGMHVLLIEDDLRAAEYLVQGLPSAVMSLTMRVTATMVCIWR